MSAIQEIINDCAQMAERGHAPSSGYSKLVMILRALDVLTDATLKEKEVPFGVKAIQIKHFEEEACEYCREMGWTEPK